jgi:alanine racemase
MKPNTTKAKSGPTGFLQRVGQARQENFQTRDQNDQAIIELNAGALQKNYQAIADLAPGQWILPMLKANAYGHGAAWVAKILVSMPDLYGFGVATLEEGVEVRVTLGSRHRKVPVIVFSGATPWSTRCGEGTNLLRTIGQVEFLTNCSLIQA